MGLRYACLLAVMVSLGVVHFGWADTSDPKDVAINFYTALAKGDAKAAKALSIAGPREEKWIEANAAMNAGFRHVYAAALAKFGTEGARRFADKPPAEYSAALVEKSPVRQSNDEAGVMVNEKTGAAIVLTRLDGQWKMDWTRGMKDKDLRPQTALYTRMAEALDGVTDGIRSGMYATAADAERQLKARFLEVASSQPATAP